MKMNKANRLISVLLALLLTLSCALPAVAEEAVMTEFWYQELAKAAAAGLYDKLMQTTTYEEVREATKGMTRTEIVNFLGRLLSDGYVTDFTAYDEYLWALYEEYIDRETYVIPVTYTNAAPLVDFSSAAEASVLSLQTRAGEDDSTTTADSGVSLTKTIKEFDGTEGVIRLEAFSTGSYTETTTSSAIDVIMVLDLSNSMYNHGDNSNPYTINNYTYTYTDLEEGIEPTQGQTYYVVYNNAYVPVSYCKTCSKWTYGCFHEPNSDNYVRYGVELPYTQYTYQIRTENADGTIRKVAALRTAVINFVTALNGMSTTADNRLAIVTFNSKATVITGTEDETAGAFVNMRTDGSTAISLVSNDNINEGVWKTAQGTATADGTEAAYNILADAYGETPSTTDLAARKRIVVVFTDGLPNPTSNAAASIADAYDIKNTYDSTVYTIGIVNGADGTVPFTTEEHSSSSNSIDINQYLHYLSSNFQNATNYTTRTDPTYPEYGSYYLSASDSGTLNTIFTMIAGQIQTDLDNNANLGSTTTTTIDVLSDYFTLPSGVTNTSGDIKVYTADCTGGTYTTTNNETVVTSVSFSSTETALTTANISITADETGNNDMISVSNFSFADNWCGPEVVTENGTTKVTWRGKKLIIEIPFEVKDGFLGGNGVPTNTAAGVYTVTTTSNDDGTTTTTRTPVETADTCYVNVPTQPLTVHGDDQHIYLSNTADLQVLTESFGTDYTLGGIVYDVDGKRNQYVKLVYTLKSGTTELGTYTIGAGQTTGTWEAAEGLDITPLLTDDAQYTIVCDVIPDPSTYDEDLNGVAAIAKNTSATGNVYVYTPEVTFQDSVEKYMDVMDEATQKEYYEATGNNKLYTYTTSTDTAGNTTVTTTNVVWKNANTDKYSTEVTMSGLEPELTFDYDVVSAEDPWLNANKAVIATADVPVTVKTTITGDTVVVDASDLTGTFVEGCVKYIRNQYLTTADDDKDCSSVTCGWTSGTESKNNPAFVIHIYDVLGDLVIQKSGLETGESAIFYVTITPPDSTDSTVYTIVLTGTDAAGSTVSARLTKLLVNSSVAVTEDSNWSWRYNLSTSDPTCTNNWKIVAQVDSSTTPTTVTIANKRITDQWLSDESKLDNVFNATTSNTTQEASSNE